MLNDQDKVIGKFFDDCARNGFMESFDDEERVKLNECLGLMNITQGTRILEPGNGSGRLTAVLAGMVGESGQVTACDISPVMVEKACARNLPSHVHVYCGSVTKVPAECGFFDIALCFQVFPHFTDRAASLAEIRRVLKTGGDLWIVHLASRETINNRHKDAGGPVISHKIPDEDEMRNILSINGFEVLDIHDTETMYRLHARIKQA